MKIAFDVPEPTTDTAAQQAIELSERAAKRIAQIMQEEDKAYMLRVGVYGGGCSGFSYNFKLVEEKDPSDMVIENAQVPDVKVLVDMMSFNYIKGSVIDFEETLEASQFVVKNPNAKSSCGCGSSFSL